MLVDFRHTLFFFFCLPFKAYIQCKSFLKQLKLNCVFFYPLPYFDFVTTPASKVHVGWSVTPPPPDGSERAPLTYAL